ncbi:BnaC01g42290D [Brassica napus]|uniref:BnaC01g42290D protein n=1 Tax=Brassica napus TaxID=3708 RepID=A0A078IX95_BRANA|nr:BnaC01g42290D [Brassica napus]
MKTNQDNFKFWVMFESAASPIKDLRGNPSAHSLRGVPLNSAAVFDCFEMVVFDCFAGKKWIYQNSPPPAVHSITNMKS